MCFKAWGYESYDALLQRSPIYHHCVNAGSLKSSLIFFKSSITLFIFQTLLWQCTLGILDWGTGLWHRYFKYLLPGLTPLKLLPGCHFAVKWVTCKSTYMHLTIWFQTWYLDLFLTALVCVVFINFIVIWLLICFTFWGTPLTLALKTYYAHLHACAVCTVLCKKDSCVFIRAIIIIMNVYTLIHS